MNTQDIELIDQVTKLNEGWAIFSCYGTTSEWRIERIDEEMVFATDGDAIRHVFKMSLYGSKVHANVLEFMRRYGSATENLFISKIIAN